jgi:16S rRNA (guanine1207-N2)-methyltransferase
MIRVQIHDLVLQFETDASLFSPGHADRGTLHMLDHVTFLREDIVLDLGCGYGLVGVYAGMFVPPEQVIMTDIQPLAVKIAADNVRLNHLTGVTVVCGNAYESVERSDFTLILSNPPYHTDFSVAKTFLEKGFNRLAIGGRFYMVQEQIYCYFRRSSHLGRRWIFCLYGTENNRKICKND